MKKTCVLILSISLFLFGCGRQNNTMELVDLAPSDTFTQKICENKTNNFYYMGYNISSSGVKQYEFWGDELTAENISDFANVVMAAELDSNEKTSVLVIVSTVSGAGGSFALMNYTNDSTDLAEYNEICVLQILDQSASWDALCDPLTFTRISGIKYLNIDANFQKEAEKEGIDWYKVWPDLEGMDTF